MSQSTQPPSFNYSPEDNIRAFMQAGQQNCPQHLSLQDLDLRLNLLDEEWLKELQPALDKLRRLEQQRSVLGFSSPEDEEAFLDAWTEVFDALIDSVVIIVGSAISFGLPFDEGWQIVQQTNMAKFIPCDRCIDGKLAVEESVTLRERPCPNCNGTGKVAVKRPDGKVLKPKGWTPPEAKLKELIRSRLRPPEMRQTQARNQHGQPFEALPVTPPVVKP